MLLARLLKTPLSVAQARQVQLQAAAETAAAAALLLAQAPLIQAQHLLHLQQWQAVQHCNPPHAVWSVANVHAAGSSHALESVWPCIIVLPVFSLLFVFR